jgi:hypothetical protein
MSSRQGVMRATTAMPDFRGRRERFASWRLWVSEIPKMVAKKGGEAKGNGI